MSTSGVAPKAQRPKKPKKRVDNTGATGDKIIYRTKAYTYLEKDGDLVRVPGASPINDVSVVHGPPPPKKLAEINKKSPKPKKIALSTVSIVVLTMLYVSLFNAVSALEVTSNKCYKDASSDNCYWLDPSKTAPTRCLKCPRTDRKEHLIIGSNGLGIEWSNIIFVNSTTGRVNVASAVGRLAPAIEGTLLWEIVDIVNIIAKEGSLKRVRQHEARISTLADNMHNMREEQQVKFQEHLSNMDSETAEIKTAVEHHKQELTNVRREVKSDIDTLRDMLNQAIEKTFRLDDFVVKQSAVTQGYVAEISRLKQQVRKLETQTEKMEEEMSQLIMDAVNAMLHKRSFETEVHMDYGVAAMKTPPLLRLKRQDDEGMDIDTPTLRASESATVLKIRYGFVDLELKQSVVKNCSCTNGVMKLCNIEVKFNSTKAYKPDESTYCLLNVSTSNGIMTRKERLNCKQSDMRDACTLSLVVGRAIEMTNVTLVRIGDGHMYLDNEKLLFKNKLVRVMCDYADEDRPYHLKPTSKYRPIFIMCNITSKDDLPDRNSNRLHYMVVVCAIVLTIIVETIYQSWVVGIEVLTAALLGLLFVLEDALISASMQLRNYAALVVLVGCFGAMTTSRTVSAALWIVMLGWLYTVEAIDGMTFTVNGVKGLNKVTYETSLNMHAGDTLLMGNVSLSLIEIRQRREYDYVYSTPTVISMSSLCRSWDCANTAPNCNNKCDGECGDLSYARCTAMQMYHSCVWSPLQCALCEGTGALYEKLCFIGKEVCNIFDSPSNQGDREIVLEYNIDGRTERHVVKVGQDAYSSGGIFRITELEILSTSTNTYVFIKIDKWAI